MSQIRRFFFGTALLATLAIAPAASAGTTLDLSFKFSGKIPPATKQYVKNEISAELRRNGRNDLKLVEVAQGTDTNVRIAIRITITNSNGKYSERLEIDDGSRQPEGWLANGGTLKDLKYNLDKEIDLAVDYMNQHQE